MNLIGKSKEAIDDATRNKSRSDLIEIIYSLATLEPMYSAGTVARRRGLSKDKILQLCHDGIIPKVHKPLQNSFRIPLSSIHAWDAQTVVNSKER